MHSTNRRSFILHVAAGSSALAASQVMAQSGPKLDEKDPTAVGLGYSPDTTKVDAKKYPKHASDQKCGACQLYAGKPGDASGPCPIFAGKLVQAKGWCSAFVKKA